ncbi:MAG TPA: DNA polymerase III subunit beta [Syntrophorhabdales bacterium]|nr:DNA polymerase III subunit beta [Syntrophorhabdales bacterium]
MKIDISRDLLLVPLTKQVSITERRSIMPILSNVLIDLSKNRINLYSTDLELSAISHVEYEGSVEKKLVIHGRKFLDILKEMEPDAISLEVKDNTLTLTQKQSEFVLGLQDSEEFPEVKEIAGIQEFSVDGGTFLEMLEKVQFAISSDETRYVLTGMYMLASDGILSVVGTDGFRMALCRKSIDGLGDFKGVIIPKRSIGEIGRVVGEGETVRIVMGEKHAQFGTGSVVLISRLIEGGFPDYENVIPKNNSNIAKVEKIRFLKGLRKVSTIISKSEPIKITLRKDQMVIEAESEVGRAKENIEAVYQGEEMSMNFNIRFVLEVVGHIDEKEILVSAPSTYGAVLFAGDGNETYKNIVMPIRV